jgi:DNA-binding NarL/FixJ family response regulator
MKVLLVEDHRELSDELQRILHAIGGFQVVSACATSREALAWLARHSGGWDLALVDLFLQEGNGFEVLRGCAGRDEQQKVVVFSNYAREPAREYARQAGADAFFDKALELDALVAYCASHAKACRLRSGPSPRPRTRQAARPGERR